MILHVREYEAALLCLPGEHGLMDLPSMRLLPYFSLAEKIIKKTEGKKQQTE